MATPTCDTKLNWTMSPGCAITVDGMKVRALLAPTVTCQVAAYADEDRINSTRNGVEKCILAFRWGKENTSEEEATN
jgi:hypothetical protein